MHILLKLFFYFITVCMTFMSATSSGADWLMPAAIPPCIIKPNNNVVANGMGRVCGFSLNKPGSGMFEAGQTIGTDPFPIGGGMSSVDTYVPKDGLYRIAAFASPGCSISISGCPAGSLLTESQPIHFRADRVLVAQQGWGNYPTTTLPARGMFCLGLISEEGDYYSLRDDTGSSSKYWTCNNFKPLPNTPNTPDPGNPGGNTACHIMASGITFNLGEVDRSDVMNNAGSIQNTSSLDASCGGNDNHTISFKLQMTPTGWSNSQISTSNSDLGVILMVDGHVISNGDSFNMSVAGTSSKPITAYLVKNPGTSADAISTGGYRASATLIATEN